MPDQHEFIEDIYNYCDYICHKCVFSRKCYLYWVEHHENAGLETGHEEIRAWTEFFQSEESGEDPYHSEFSMARRYHQDRHEQRTREIIEPAHKIISILDPILEEITLHDYNNSAIDTAIDLVLENYLLIAVKYYRAVHQTLFDPEIDVDMEELYNYLDTEKTLLAVKAFLWNLRFGIRLLRPHYPEYLGEFTRISTLSRLIEERIDKEFLPVTREILQRYDY